MDSNQYNNLSGNQPGDDTTNNNSNQNNAAGSNQSSGTSNANTSTVANSSASGTGSSTTPYTAAQRGTGFTNLQNILSANSNNNLGNAVNQGIQQSSQQTQSDINNAQQNFLNQSNANNLNNAQNQQYINNTFSNLSNQAGLGSNGYAAQNQANTASSLYTPDSNLTTSAAATQASPGSTQTGNIATGNTGTAPTYQSSSYAPTTNDLNQFQKFLSGNYSGPTTLANQQNLNLEAQDVQNQSQALQSSAGLQGLLQRYVGSGQYGTGEQNLDALILGQTGAPQLSQARLATQGIQNVNDLANADTAIGQTYQKQAKDLQNQVQGNITNLGSNLQNALNTEAGNQNTSAGSALQSLQNDISTNKLSAQDQSTIKNLLGLDPNGPIYATQQDIQNALAGITANKATASNYATQGQYDVQQALQQLSGATAGSNSLGGLNLNQSQVATAPTGLLSANQAAITQLQNAQNQGQTAFNKAIAQQGIYNPTQQAFLQSKDFQGDVGQIGAILNSIGQQGATVNVDPNTGAVSYSGGDQAAISSGQQQIQNLENKLNQELNTNGITNLSSQINNLGNYGGNRSYNLGEGASQFLQNINNQNQELQNIEKNQPYFSNLTNLLKGQLG